MSELLVYALVPIAVAAVAVVLLMGLSNMARGGSPHRSQKLMRMRVLLQFLAIIVIMLTIWAIR
jgi:Hypoxia induced protein conserved region